MQKMRTHKNTYHILTALTGIAVSMASCTMESSDNGKLDGFWHLEQVDTLATGGKADLSDKRIFWGVQHKLISIKDYDTEGFYCRFRQTGDSLILSSPYLNHWHQDHGDNGGDIPMKSVSDNLRRCGINHIEEHFCKLRLTGEEMILKNEELILKFKKF